MQLSLFDLFQNEDNQPTIAEPKAPPSNDTPSVQAEMPWMPQKPKVTKAKSSNQKLTPQERLEQNLRAVKHLYFLEDAGRSARAAGDKNLLAGYTSFGAIPKVFEEDHKDYQLVKDTLNEADYAAARAATVNSFYTHDIITMWMWDRLSLAGFKGGHILDPAMATGNFFSTMHKTMKYNSTLIGVEMDCLAGRIGRMIHPEAEVHISPYQRTKLPLNAFDLTITNVPFGDITIYDKALGNHSIHNYFIMQMVQHTRPGGLIAAITSRYTMDSKSSSHREWLARNVNLLGAVRLPTNTFRAYAGTDVVTDILFMQKPEDGHPEDIDPSWIETEAVTMEGPRGPEEITLSNYFQENPQHVLGEYQLKTGQYSAKLVVNATEPDPVKLIYNTPFMPPIVYTPREDNIIRIEVDDESTLRPGEFYFQDGELRQRNAYGYDISKAIGLKADRILGQIKLVQAARIVLQMNADGTDLELSNAQHSLRFEYDSFKRRFGILNSKVNRQAFKSDPNAPFLWALEAKNDKGAYEPTDIFYHRTIQAARRPDFVEDATDALAISIADTGGIDWDLITSITQKSQDQLTQELQQLIFLNPDTNSWEPAHIYLSGNVRLKLQQAKEASGQPAHGLTKMQPNIDALNEVQPEWLTHENIHPALGAPWIDAKHVEQFHYELLHPESPINKEASNDTDTLWNYETELRWGNRHVSKIDIRYNPQLNNWMIQTKRSYGTLAVEKWGTVHKPAHDLIKAILNKTEIKVWDEDTQGNRWVDQDATIAAQQKAHEIKQEFQRWIWSDEERRTELEAIYNNTFNAVIPTTHNGSWLTFPGLNTQFSLRPHQENAVSRVLAGDNTLLWHIVGAGKSLAMIASSMKAKQLGLRNKPMHVVPNHLLHQYAAEFYRFYPGANILVIDPKSMAPQERDRALGQIATGNWDSVIITHSTFNRIPLSPDTHAQFHQRRIHAINAVIDELSHSHDQLDKRTVKQLEKKRLRLTEKYERTTKKLSYSANGLYWETLGVDMLFVDECHMFKNLYFESTMAAYMPGISGTESGKAYDMYMKTQQLTRRCTEGHIIGEFKSTCKCGAERDESTSLIFASGTPITNSICEMYTMQRFLQLDELIRMGITNFDAWATQFGDEVTSIEMKPSGKGWRQMTRFARFYNVPELTTAFALVADAQMDPTVLQLERPELMDGEPVGVSIQPSDALLEYVDACSARAENIKNVDSSVDNMLKIMGDALKAATDMRLVNRSMDFEPGCKIDVVTDKVYRIWKQNPGTTQAIFLDISTPKPGRWSLYGDMKQRWIDMGIPEEEIAFAHDAKTDVQRRDLFERVNEAKIRIIIGSTEKMGAGTNMQKNLYALHHIDAPWTPALIEQREGRILRQGNNCKEVEIYRYVTEKSLDFYKWHLLETKARFIMQISRGQVTDRSVEDIEANTISFAQMKAIATGDPLLMEQVSLEADIQRLSSLVSSALKSQHTLRNKIKDNKQRIPQYQSRIELLTSAIAIRDRATTDEVSINGNTYEDSQDFYALLKEKINKLPFNQNLLIELGYKNATATLEYRKFGDTILAFIQLHKLNRQLELGSTAKGIVQRFRNYIDALDKQVTDIKGAITKAEQELHQQQLQLATPIPQLEEYREKETRLEEIHQELKAQAIADNSQPTEENNEDSAEEPTQEETKIEEI